MYSIHLKNIKLYGKHGVFAEEQLLDAPFEVNITCCLKKDCKVQNLGDTVNYATVFDILKKHFSQSYSLLEVLAKDILDTLKKEFSIIEKVTISIYKLNPPISGMQGQVGITLEL